MKVQNNKLLKRLPDHILIEEANRIEKSFVDWSGGYKVIDEILQNRNDEISEELTQYEEWQEFDDALLNLV